PSSKSKTPPSYPLKISSSYATHDAGRPDHE
ncbi:MAG: hypothetical protein ACI8R8_003087, partial [Paraglaciecola sp.]